MTQRGVAKGTRAGLRHRRNGTGSAGADMRRSCPGRAAATRREAEARRRRSPSPGPRRPLPRARTAAKAPSHSASHALPISVAAIARTPRCRERRRDRRRGAGTSILGSSRPARQRPGHSAIEHGERRPGCASVDLARSSSIAESSTTWRSPHLVVGSPSSLLPHSHPGRLRLPGLPVPNQKFV